MRKTLYPYIIQASIFRMSDLKSVSISFISFYTDGGSPSLTFYENHVHGSMPVGTLVYCQLTRYCSKGR